MNWVTGIVVYLIIWWTVLFAVLPWGVRVPDRPEPGHADSAPAHPRLWRKALITTAISTALWIAFYFFQKTDIISFRDFAS
jgi:predicted secreted protein